MHTPLTILSSKCLHTTSHLPQTRSNYSCISKQFNASPLHQQGSIPICSWCPKRWRSETCHQPQTYVNSRWRACTVKALLQKDDWMAKIDLKDDFFMVPIALQFYNPILYRVLINSNVFPFGLCITILLKMDNTTAVAYINRQHHLHYHSWPRIYGYGAWKEKSCYKHTLTRSIEFH